MDASKFQGETNPTVKSKDKEIPGSSSGTPIDPNDRTTMPMEQLITTSGGTIPKDFHLTVTRLARESFQEDSKFIGDISQAMKRFQDLWDFQTRQDLHATLRRMAQVLVEVVALHHLFGVSSDSVISFAGEIDAALDKAKLMNIQDAKEFIVRLNNNADRYASSIVQVQNEVSKALEDVVESISPDVNYDVPSSSSQDQVMDEDAEDDYLSAETSPESWSTCPTGNVKDTSPDSSETSMEVNAATSSSDSDGVTNTQSKPTSCLLTQLVQDLRISIDKGTSVTVSSKPTNESNPRALTQENLAASASAETTSSNTPKTVQFVHKCFLSPANSP